MKYLADENLGIKVVKLLRNLGVDIVSVADLASFGIKDPKVFSLASKEDRILITLDRDFGELVFKQKLAHTGVIFLRLKNESVNNKLKVLSMLLKQPGLKGKFTVYREK